MTAVKSIDGAPLAEGPMAAVQIEPSGLFFKEIATLTIVPAKELPVKDQIVFGYEGDGKDYHLGVVDPKSKDIKGRSIVKRQSGLLRSSRCDRVSDSGLLLKREMS